MSCAIDTPATWDPLPDSLIDFTTQSVGSLLNCPASLAGATQPLPPLSDFIRETVCGAKLSVEILLATLVYFERFKKALPSGSVGEYGACHRIFLAGILIASKFLDDKPLTTAKLVQVVGNRWSSKEINRMERAFLNFLQFDLWVDSEEIHAFLQDNGVAMDWRGSQ
ncbi:hypothetical protein K493DRAFT_363256 [Basidiobolus meristosporus CBS 931.73]|uniref:Cyclin-like domain-containing protein n=1 Tax=Basidiobolus meristosporus CBS 931.73 TaxID=1314790 RepID=A0A1Y1WVP8_9FUNG|nr:hypothetical protein K493DRAFT_363256 [Basidiobolus meristosporus CBS 931.73]|eukprot:ORX77610.1 hypothetical protein K493DRAFT_363256 [Basidiobolus meristosporus CBS 931.73]